MHWRVNLMDLFTNAQIRKFTQTVGSVWWNKGWWINERRDDPEDWRAGLGLK